MFNYYSISFFLIFIILLWFSLVLGVGAWAFNSVIDSSVKYFIFDSISIYLILLIVIIGVYSNLSFFSQISAEVQFFLFLSLFFSILCFCMNHSILFWCLYELAMLPLLYLIFKESPYSERFLAGWYFACYLLITSLPLVLILFYLALNNNSFFFNEWSYSSGDVWLLLVISFVFFTKVPLVPFHTWLPIVHAEATSIVSIFLSGYIMKLGLLGVYRCSYFLFNSDLLVYIFICFIASISFILVASGELDGKRWLALLSLSHITVPFFAFFISNFTVINNAFFYCLAHGLSAGGVFGLLWYFYDFSNSRNWLLLKSSVNFKSVILLLSISMLSLCSFPTTIQFFCEVELVKVSSSYWLYLIFWCLYLFFGGLVPLVLCGHLYIRSEWVEIYTCDKFNYLNYILFSMFWCYCGLFIV